MTADDFALLFFFLTPVWLRQRREDLPMDQDPLGPARGIGIAVVVGLIFWALVALTCWQWRG